MKIIFLDDSSYDEEGKNYGDCIIIDTGENLVVYDCGSEEHAKVVIDYMNNNNYNKVDIILSHNDSDHFKGIEYLISEDKVSSITTLLLLKHIDDIMDEIDDGRRSREGIKKQIKEEFDNIVKLTGNNLCDAFDNSLSLHPCINFVGPSFDYMIEAVAKQLNNSESDMIDSETIMNAISVQVEIIVGNHKVLLTGDASFEAIKDKIREYDSIQLPHHGKKEQADKIFEENDGRSNVIYLVSDNTGNSNGGSDDLMEDCIGRKIKNTKNGSYEINIDSFNNQRKGCYSNAIYYIK